MENLKIKYLTKEQLIISTNRLTRFKEPETKYLRVFKDIISNSLIFPAIKKNDIEKMSYEKITELATYIINSSVKHLGLNSDDDYLINQRIFDYENSIFKISDNVNMLLKNKINYKSILNILPNDIPFNLRWLKSLQKSLDIKSDRVTRNFKYPLEKIILAEGITEEILLPKFAQIYGYDFNKNGVYVLSAGGKNQVVKYFYQYSEILKIPIFVLLDKDAQSNYEQILPKLRDIDKVHIIDCGEFEDLLPKDLIKRTLSEILKNISIISDDEINYDISRVKMLEELFRNRGLHEFKKAEFAQFVKNEIFDKKDVSEEISQIFEELKKLKISVF